MIWYIVKLIVSAGIIVLISELSKKLPLLASLVASLPLVSVLGMIWMYGEKVEVEKIAAHSVGTFWYVLPSLPMFLVMPLMLRKGISFPTSLLYDDQSSGQIWHASLGVFDSILREPFI